MKGTYSLSLSSEQINAALNRVHNEDFIEKDSLDSTFSESGAPAESKAIGDRLTEVFGYIASPYDNSKTYKAKDLCSYENQIYICVTDINKPEWFNNSHWVSVTIGTALTSITQMEDLITHLITLRGLTPAEFKAVAQSGRAKEFFKVDDVIYIPWTDNNVDPVVTYEIPHVIVDFITAEDENGNTYENSPVLQWLYGTIYGCPFDAPEQIPCTEGTVIESGYYYYQKSEEDYVLLDPQPEVGSLVPAGSIYYKHIWNNAGNVIRYGLNNYHLSAIHQYLNSDVNKDVGWWASQHDCDVSPDSSIINRPGFMNGYNSEWKAIFNKTKVQTKGNNLFFSEAIDTDYDYFFLPSASQINGANVADTYEGKAWQYWKNVTGTESYIDTGSSHINNAYKIPAYPGTGSSVGLRLRSARLSSTANTYYVNGSGYVSYNSASNASRALPVTVILGRKL